MLRKKKSLPKQNPAIVINPNKSNFGPYALEDEEDKKTEDVENKEETEEMSEDLNENDMDRLNKQLAQIDETKKQLLEIKAEKEKVVEEVPEVEEKVKVQEVEVPEVDSKGNQTVIVSGFITEHGNFRYTLDSTYPLQLGDCKIIQ